MPTVVMPKDMTLSEITDEIRKLEKPALGNYDEDEVDVRDAIRLDELRKEEKNQTRTNLSMASRTGKNKKKAIPPRQNSTAGGKSKSKSKKRKRRRKRKSKKRKTRKHY